MLQFAADDLRESANSLGTGNCTGVKSSVDVSYPTKHGIGEIHVTSVLNS